MDPGILDGKNGGFPPKIHQKSYIIWVGVRMNFIKLGVRAPDFKSQSTICYIQQYPIKNDKCLVLTEAQNCQPDTEYTNKNHGKTAVVTFPNHRNCASAVIAS